jgi:hypothetical protein
MVSTKVAGWLLLILGLAIIFYSLYSSWQVFTGKMAFPEIFKISLTKTDSGSSIPGVDQQLEKIIGSQLGQLLPANATPTLLNLLSWSVLAGILIFGGSQVSNIGIKLLK